MEMTAKKILIIDDDKRTLEMAAKLLEPRGFAVVTYGGKFDRLNFVVRNKPDLVLLGVNMPFLAGDELFKLFADHPSLKDIPVAYFSSNDEASLRLMVIQTGAAGYISKSEMGADFAGKVARILDRVERKR